MLPWYLRPIEPSRVVPLWAWHILPSALVLAWFVTFVAFVGPPTPDAFPEPMYPFVLVAPWASVAASILRRRQLGGRSPVSILGLTLLAIALTVLALPALLWPNWPDREPPTSLVSTTSLLCWLSAGVLAAVGVYFIVSDAFGVSRRRAS